MMAEQRTVASIWERYATLTLAVGDQGGGDRTLNDIAFLVAEIERLRVTLERVDWLFTQVMDESNLHIFEPVAAEVTAALAQGRQPMTEQEPCQRCKGTGWVYNTPDYPEDYNPILRWHGKECPECKGGQRKEQSEHG